MRVGEDSAAGALEAGTSEPMLDGQGDRRFSQTGVYRDVTFALLFGLQLVGVLTIALVNGARVAALADGSAPQPPPASGSSSSLAMLSAEMMTILAVASVSSALLALAWLALLQTGARPIIFAGASVGTGLAFGNAVWLLASGGAAATTLGLLSLVLCAGCVAYMLLNRRLLDFSSLLLSTVALILRAFPATLGVAAAGAAAGVAWLLLWSSALASTVQLPRQGAPLGILLLSFFWTLQTIKAVVHATVAGTVASWYFLSPNVPPHPTVRSLRRACTTSLGSLCLGALLASSLQATRSVARTASRRLPCPLGLRSAGLCLLGFVDVLLRFCNEYAYTQVAIYGKSFSHASRDTWTLLVHHSGVEVLMQRDIVQSSLSLGCAVGGLCCATMAGLWGRAAFGAGSALWWQAQLAGFAIGYASLSIVSSAVNAGVAALYVCYAEDPTPLSAIAPSLYSTFIAQPHVPTATGAGRSADGRSAFGAFIDRVSAAAAPPDETVYRQADGGGGHSAAAGKRGGGGAAGQAGSSSAQERLAPATQDL